MPFSIFGAFSTAVRIFVSTNIVICLTGILTCNCDENEYRLIKDLLRDYDPRVRPSLNASHALNVTFGLALSQIIDVDEKNQIITTNCWLNQVWIDPKLKWVPDQYGGLRVIRLPHDAIWKPDILLYNNADVSSYRSSISTNVIVTANGNVTWLSMVIFRSSCAIDVTYFPFDEQNCSMQFASWTYDGLQLNLVKVGDDGDASNYIHNTEWSLVKLHVERHEVFYSCCDEPYPDITYTVQMRRKPLFYVFNMILPCFIITLVALLGFYIPSDSGEKVSMGITTLLSMTVFLMLVAENMPPTSDVLPLVGLYYGITIVIVSLATAMTVLTLNIHHKGVEGIPVPGYIKLICFRFFARILCLKIQKHERAYKEENRGSDDNGQSAERESSHRACAERCAYVKMNPSRYKSTKFVAAANDRTVHSASESPSSSPATFVPASAAGTKECLSSKDFLHEDISLHDMTFLDCGSGPENGRRGFQAMTSAATGGNSTRPDPKSAIYGLRSLATYAIPPPFPPPSLSTQAIPHQSSLYSSTYLDVTSTSSTSTMAAATLGRLPADGGSGVEDKPTIGGLLQQQQQPIQHQETPSHLERRLTKTLNKLCQTIDRGDLRLADDDRRLANRIEWQQVSVVVDRVLLIIFTVGTVAITAGILLHAPHSKRFLFGASESDGPPDVDTR